MTLACGPYDRMLALYTGDVRVEGVDLNFLVDDNPRTYLTAWRPRRSSTHQSSPAPNTSLASWPRNAPSWPSPFVFASRMFRHSFIFVNRKHIKNAKDLEGKRVGVPVYTMTAALFIRGLLSDEYGVDFSQNEWVEGDINSANSHGDPTILPTIKKMSISASEIQYYRCKKIFPIMHTVVIRRDVHEKNPFVATALYRALNQAKDIALEKMKYRGTLRYMLPWMTEELDQWMRCSAGILGLTVSKQTGRRSTRWCAISWSRVSFQRLRES
jgi:4,5-dihydroxyphthalate decarboxylase